MYYLNYIKKYLQIRPRTRKVVDPDLQKIQNSLTN